MRDLNTILRDIQARADSLAIFAQHAAALDSTVSTRKTEYAENALDNLAALQSLQNELLTYFLTLLKQEKAEKTESYTDLNGEIVQVEMLDWLEDGYYTDDEGDRMPCSRYCIGHEDGDGISVWLNDDMQEVTA